MIVNITNEVFTKLKNEIKNATVLTSYNLKNPQFPCITFVETSNTKDDNTIDSSGETVNILAFEVNIFTTGNMKLSRAIEIRQAVDNILSDYYKMSRDFASETPNYLDDTIYRYTMRYSCLVDKNKTIYRGN